MYNEQDFEQAYDVLHNFGATIRGTVGQMRTDAETCATNMEEDIVAQNASGSLIQVLDRITEILDTQLNSLLAKLDEEKERARQLAQEDE